MGSIIKHKKYKEQCKLCISEPILFIGSVVAGGTKNSRADTREVGEHSRFQVTGMIEWGQKSKPKKFSGPKCNPKKTHAEFPSHEGFTTAKGSSSDYTVEPR